MGHLLTPVLFLALCVATSGFLFPQRPPERRPPQPQPPAPAPAPSECPLLTTSVEGFPRCVAMHNVLPLSRDWASGKCNALGQRLLMFEDLFKEGAFIQKHFLKNIWLRLKGGLAYWIGGILPSARGAFQQRLRNIDSEKDSNFRALFLPMLKRIKTSDDKDACFALLSGDRSEANLNRCASLKDDCLMLTPNSLSFRFQNCAFLKISLCESGGDDVGNTEWSQYLSNQKPNAVGEYEHLSMHIRTMFATQGKCICRIPLNARCRIVGETELLDEKNNQGFKFTLTPTTGFICLHSQQSRGKQCPDVEVSYLCPKETDTCDSPGARAKCQQKEMECVNRCGAGHFCRRVPKRTNNPSQGQCCLGENQDRCYDTGVCSAQGDPHYLTFDGLKIDYMGPCTYTLVESVSVTGGCPAFIVEAENRVKPGHRPTWLKTIILKYKGHRVELRQKKVVTVADSEVNLPYKSQDDAFVIKTRGSGPTDYLVLRTDFCLVIHWDGDRKVKVEAPTSCKTRVRGLCGNWNGNKPDDWTRKNGDLVNMRADRYQMATELGNSWEVPNPNGVPGTCKTQELKDCTVGQMAKFNAKTSCGMLLDRSGPFKSYLDKPSGMDFLTSLQEACIEDACNSDEPDVCSALQKAEDELTEAFGGVILEDWRKTSSCPSRCPDQMFFNPSMTSCQPTCQNNPEDDDVASIECADPMTFPGCQCEDGLVLSGTRCIPRSQCGCTTPEGYIEVGKEIVTQDCRLRYRCVQLPTGNAETKSEPFGSCSRDADCKAGKCVCKPGYRGNGKTCEADRVKCPLGYHMRGSMCYRSYFTRKTWMEAQEVCGCGSGGEAQLCAAHTDAQLTFLTQFLTQVNIAIWAAGNTLAETVSYNVTMQTTPSKVFSRLLEAGCYVFVRDRSGLIPQVKDCNLKLPFCCQVDPVRNKDLTPVWTPYVAPWSTPDGGSAFNAGTSIKRGDLMCPSPRELDCLTEDGKSWMDAGVRAMCNPQRSFLCSGQSCPKFKVRGLCLPDIDECKVLGSNACSGGKQCVNCIGGYTCQCPGTSIPDANGKCVTQHKSCGKCIASGDPHYTKFGDLRFDWQGRCKYVLTQTCPFKMTTDPPFPCFKVVAKNKPCGGSSSRVTCTEYVEVHIYRKCSDMALYRSDRIFARLDGDGTFSFGGKDNRKDVVDTDALRISVNSGLKLTELTTPWGMKVTFRRWYVVVELPGESQGRMCGLCGDCLTPNAYNMPNGTEVTFRPSSSRVPDDIVRKVGLAYQEPDESDPTCEPPPPTPQPVCSPAELNIVKDSKNCGFYKDARFNGCRQVANEEYENCLVDLCAFVTKPDFGQQKCDRISDLVQSCRASQGVQASQISWRTAEFCPLDCNDTEIFSDNAMTDETCGDVGETNLNGLEPVEGCVCQGGFKRDPVSGMCVPRENCGCTVSFELPPGGTTSMVSFYIAKGQVATGSAECKQVRCDGDDDLVVLQKELDPVRGICDITKVPPTPSCQKGFIGDGFNCTPNPAECEEGWTKVNGRCLFLGPDKVTWWQAAVKCAEMDAVLAFCRTDNDCQDIQREGNVSGITFWSRGMVQWKDNVAKPLIEAVGVSASIPGIENYLPGKMPDNTNDLKGDILCHAFESKNTEIKAKLFPCGDRLHFVCVKRDPGDPKVPTPWCQTRNPLSRDQVETTSRMQEKDCKICRNPTDVECRAADPADREKSQNDSCGAMGERLYSCQASADGPDCFTKEIRGQCYPGLDECALKLDHCGPDASCRDLYYGYRCQCDPTKGTEVNGRCIPFTSCKLEREMSGSLALTVPSFGRKLSYRTRCKYVMAGSCGPNFPGRPEFQVEVEGVMEPTNPEDLSNVIVTVQLTSPTRNNKFSIDKGLPSGMIRVSSGGAGNELPLSTLPMQMDDATFGVKILPGDEGRVVFVRSGQEYLRIEVCLSPGCQTLVSVQVSSNYGRGCGVCNASSGLTFNHTEDLLEANRNPGSPVTCGRVEPPDPPTPTNSPVCGPLFNSPSSCGLLKESGGPFEGCSVDVTECITMGCKHGRDGVCNYILSAIRNCPQMTANERESALLRSECMPKCPDNMRFSVNVLTETPTCMDPNRQTPTGGLSEMKCVCDANYFLHFGKCVPKADCGCVHSGVYVERGAVWISDDCNTMYKCKGENIVQEFQNSCPGNSTCSGRGVCTCRNGFFGDCCMPAEENESGMTCYKQCSGQQVCQCKMGYVSQCGTCIDLDECAVQQHNCDAVTEICRNEPGSFRCECASGYERNSYTRKCTNINECLQAKDELGYELCGPNSMCRDRPGHYVCVCCAGFIATESGCVPDPNTPRPPNRECCHCMGRNCLEQGALCYTEQDGARVDYSSYRAMYERRCLDGKPLINTKYEKGTCGNTTPRPPPSNCNPSICTSAQKASPQGGAVCRTNNPREFPSVCEMLIQACRDNDNVPPANPPPFHSGPCVPSDTQFTPWQAWTPCYPVDQRVTCNGMGKRMRQRRVEGSTVVPEERIRQAEICNLPNCEGSTPMPVTSCGESVYCANTTAEVCARVGTVGQQMTFVNPCLVYKTACNTQETHVVILHEGPCLPDEMKPRATPCGTPLRVNKRLEEKGADGTICTSGDATIGICDNGYCPTQDANICCQTDAFIYVNQTFLCPDSVPPITFQKSIVSATSCKCQDRRR